MNKTFVVNIVLLFYVFVLEFRYFLLACFQVCSSLVSASTPLLSASEFLLPGTASVNSGMLIRFLYLPIL